MVRRKSVSLFCIQYIKIISKTVRIALVKDLFGIPHRQFGGVVSVKKKISLKSISFMRDSKISYQKWMEVVYLLLETKKTISISEIRRLTGMKRYGTVYYMVQKIRKELGVINKSEIVTKSALLKADDNFKGSIKYPLYFRVKYGKSKGEKNDRIVMELPFDFKRNCLKIQLEKSESLRYRHKKILNNSMTLYQEKNLVKRRMDERWAGILAENLLRKFEGIFHHVSVLHFQKVLDEYCFKYNHRYSSKGKFEEFFRRQIE